MKGFSCIIVLLASFIPLFYTQNENFNKRLRYHFSETYGGMSWSFVDYPFSRSPLISPQIRIKRILITYTSERLVALKLLLSDFRSFNNETWYYSSSLGSDELKNNQTFKSEWNVPHDEVVTSILLRYGSDIDAIAFLTNKGILSPTYGGKGGKAKLITLKGNLIGFAGKSTKSGNTLKQIQFVSMEIIYRRLMNSSSHLLFNIENAHASWITHLKASENGKLLISGSLDGAIKVWEFLGDDDEVHLKFNLNFLHGGLKYWTKSLILFQDYNLLASISHGHSLIKIWDLEKGRIKFNLDTHASYSSILTIIAVENTPLLASVTNEDKEIRIWDIRKGRVKFKLSLLSKDLTKGFSHLCSLNENTLASASGENFIRIWDLTARNLKFNLTYERGNKIKFLYRIDNFLMAIVCDDVISSIQIWNYRNGTFVASLITVNPIISLITFDERFLVAGLKEGSILIWNLKEKLKLKFTLHSHSGSVLSLCMLQNGGDYLASGSGHPNNLIKIWHMSNGSLYLNQDEHRDNVNVLIRLSKQIFASGSNDKSIKLWKII